MNSDTLTIIDGHSQVFKAYHAIRQLSTSTGIPTNAVYGFCQILQKLLKTRQPGHLVVAFDSGGPTFRHEMYPEYKANRPPPPEDFSQQMGLIIRVLEGMRVPIVAKPGFEADDIIATLAREATARGMRVDVVTPDKDLLQLVNDAVCILRIEPDKETEFDRAAVKEKMGVWPEQVADYLALVGDTSDNVPGIRGIGPKSAAALLEKYTTLGEVLAHAGDLKGKQAENVAAGRETALLSRKLVALDDRVPVEFPDDAFVRLEPDVPILADVFRELEFLKFLDDLGHTELPAADAPPAPIDTDYRSVSDIAQLEEFVREARAAGVFAFDTETDSLSAIRGRVVGLSLSCAPGSALYVPIDHLPLAAAGAPQISIDDVFAVLDPLFRDPTVVKVAHHLKFDLKMLDKYGFVADPPCFDTLIASFLLNPDKRGHGLKELSSTVLGVTMTPISDLIGSGRQMITFDHVDIATATRYSGADADNTLRLKGVLETRLDAAQMRDLLERIEMPLVPILMDMELCGVRIDPAHFATLSREMEAELNRLTMRLFEAAGRQFNPASPKQVADILFNHLKLPESKQKKTGASTDIEVLEELAPLHEVPRLLAEYRQIEKLRGTYVDVLPKLVEPSTGRIHTTYNQTIAATGRLSSSDPNLQNIPVRTEAGRRIREGFIPLEPGHLLLSADYSQIELRVLAHVSGDPALVEAFNTGRDVHALTASKVFGVPPAEVPSELRDHAKIINFGIIYGMGANGLASRLKIPLPEARRFIEEYFTAYAGVKAWIDRTLDEARKTGHVTTIAGRRRYLADINSKNYNARAAAERVAVNAPIQGASADMIKLAMIAIDGWLKSTNLRTRMIMQVHDELIFDVPEAEMQEVGTTVVQLMAEALPLSVPVTVTTGTGRNWAEC